MRENQEEFRIILDEGSETPLTLKYGVEEKIWRWIRRGSDGILNLNTDGLSSTSYKFKKQLETKLGGTWQINEISLTISSNPSATVTIIRKP